MIVLRRSATRRLLSAWCAGGLVLTAAAGAHAQDHKLLPPEGALAPGSYFGWSGAGIAGDRAIVGASNIPANESAFIYENVGGVWTVAGTLTPDNKEPAQNWDFGFAAGISGDHAAVGAYRTNLTGGTPQHGAVYTYHRDAGGTGNWGQTQMLSPSNLVPNLHSDFGYSLGLDGNTLAVGSPLGGSGGYGYIYEHDGSTWNEVVAVNGEHFNEQFGWSTAISGDNIIFGAPRAVHLPDGNSDGAAYIFNRNAGGEGNWGLVQKLTASDHMPGDYFGGAVAISGNTVAVGAPWTDELEVEGNPNSRSGSVYIYDFNGTEWVETAQVHASDPQTPNSGAGRDGYAYGPTSVATNGDLLVVASIRHEQPGAEIPGVEVVADGAVFIYSRNAGGTDNWGEVAVIYGELNSQDSFGSVVAIDGEHYLIGVRGDDDLGTNIGAAYIYAVPEPTTAMLLAAAGTGLLLRRRRAA